MLQPLTIPCYSPLPYHATAPSHATAPFPCPCYRYAEPPEPLALVKAAASRLRATAAEALLWQGFDWGGALQPQPVRELLG